VNFRFILSRFRSFTFYLSIGRGYSSSTSLTCPEKRAGDRDSSNHPERNSGHRVSHCPPLAAEHIGLKRQVFTASSADCRNIAGPLDNVGIFMVPFPGKWLAWNHHCSGDAGGLGDGRINGRGLLDQQTDRDARRDADLLRTATFTFGPLCPVKTPLPALPKPSMPVAPKPEAGAASLPPSILRSLEIFEGAVS